MNLSHNFLETSKRFSWVVINNVKYSEYQQGKISNFMDCIVYLKNKCFMILTYIFEINSNFHAIGNYLKVKPIEITKLGTRSSEAYYPDAISYNVIKIRNQCECITLNSDISRKCCLYIENKQIIAISVIPNMIEID